MAQSQDFLRKKLPSGDYGDILIKDGDFVIGPSDNQHIADIIMSAPGWFKEFPLLGVDLPNYLNKRDVQQLEQNINLQLQSDGYNTQNAQFEIKDGAFILKQSATRN